MAKPRNILFAALCGIVLLSVIAYNALGAAGILETKERSGIEGRAYTQLPELSTATLADGSYQKQAEEFLADHVPARDYVILENASMQRTIIEIANMAFRYDCYPTNFQSNYSAIPSHGAVIWTASAPSEADLDGVDAWISSVNKMAESHPDVRFVYDAVDDTYTSESNPTRQYVSRTWSKSWIDEHIVAGLSSSVEVIYDPIESQDEIFTQWFKTEHHWTLERALASYNKMASLLDWNEVTWENESLVTDTWYGSSARGGLDLQYADELYDIPADYSGLSCTVNGEDSYRGIKEKLAKGVDVDVDFGDPPSNAFSTYFGGVCGEAIWRNDMNPDGETCLFVEQSYGPPLEPYIARNYAVTICVDPLNWETDKSFDEYIEEYDVDVVVIQLGVRDLRKISESSPSWV